MKTIKAQPTYRDGQRILDSGLRDADVLPTIEAMTTEAQRWQQSGMPGAFHHARLWIGGWFWTLQRHGHNGAPAPLWLWHRAGGEWTPCDALYAEKPLTVSDLTKLHGQHVKLELLVEDHEKGRRTSDVGRPWRTVREINLDGVRLGREHY